MNHLNHLHPSTTAARKNCREAREAAAELAAQRAAVMDTGHSAWHSTLVKLAATATQDVYLINLTGPYLDKTYAVRVEGPDTWELSITTYGFDAMGNGFKWDPRPSKIADSSPVRRAHTEADLTGQDR